MIFYATPNPVLFTREFFLWQCSNKFRSTLRICCKEKKRWQSQVSNSPFTLCINDVFFLKICIKHLNYIWEKSIACNNHNIYQIHNLDGWTKVTKTVSTEPFCRRDMMEKAVNPGSPILSHFVHIQQWFYNISLCMFGANLLGKILVSVF